MDTITLTINDQEVKAERGRTVLEAALEAGIYIPTLCYHPSLPPYGSCRVCIVEIEGMRGLPTACTTPATDGMQVRTETPQLRELRRNILELVLSEHPHACFTCDRRERCGPLDICLRNVAVAERCVTCPKNGRCELQKVVDYVGIKEITLPYTYKGLPVERDSAFFDRDYNLCILCAKCVRVCGEIRCRGAIALTHRGGKAKVDTAFGKSHLESGCEFCGACIEACPVGALSEKETKWEPKPTHCVTTICPYCGAGCSIKLGLNGGRIVKVSPDQGVVNRGQACVKGKFGIRDDL